MRRNSPLRSFRSSTTHGGEKESKQLQQQKGMVRLKLFNTVMSELGPAFLRAGILLEPLVVKDYLTQQSDVSRGGFREILLNRRPIDMSSLLDEIIFSESTLVSLSVRPHE